MNNALMLKETLQAWQGLMPQHAMLSKFQIAPTPFDVIYEKANIRLVRYHTSKTTSESTNHEPHLSAIHQTDTLNQEPILIIPSLINRHYVLDLLPNKSLIEYLVNQGQAVYMIHWLPPEPEAQYITKEQFFQFHLTKVMEQVLADSKKEQLHLWGHCLGGTIACAMAALIPQAIRSLTLITSPIDFAEMGKLGLWAKTPEFDLQSLLDSYGNMPWPLLQSSFQFIKPSLWISKLRTLSERYYDQNFLTNFIALEIWSADNLDFPGQLYNMIIQDFYRDNKLIRGRFQVGTQVISLSDIQCPILSLMSSEDNIVPPHSGLKKEHLTALHPFEEKIINGGHIGAVLGSKAQKNLWPEMVAWIRKSEKLN